MASGDLIGAIFVTARLQDGKKESHNRTDLDFSKPATHEKVATWCENKVRNRLEFRKREIRQRFSYLIKVKEK